MAKYTLNNLPAAPAPGSSGVVVTNQVPPNFKGSVICRVISQAHGPSRKSNLPQYTLGCEILSPERYASDYDGRIYDMTSLKPMIYLSTAQVDKGGNPTDNIKYLVETLLPKLGLPAEFDEEHPLRSEANPNGPQFEGLLIELYLASREKNESRENPDGTRTQVLDSRGQPIKRGWEFGMIGRADILGLANFASGVAENRPV